MGPLLSPCSHDGETPLCRCMRSSSRGADPCSLEVTLCPRTGPPSSPRFAPNAGSHCSTASAGPAGLGCTGSRRRNPGTLSSSPCRITPWFRARKILGKTLSSRCGCSGGGTSAACSSGRGAGSCCGRWDSGPCPRRGRSTRLSPAAPSRPGGSPPGMPRS